LAAVISDRCGTVVPCGHAVQRMSLQMVLHSINNLLYEEVVVSSKYVLQVSTAADRRAKCSASGPTWCTQMLTASVINWWPRPSPLYHTDRPSKLTAPETISCSRHMVGAHQNLNGSCELTMPLSGMVCHLWASTCFCQPTFLIWSIYLYSPRRHEKWCKMSKWGGLGHWQ